MKLVLILASLAFAAVASAQTTPATASNGSPAAKPASATPAKTDAKKHKHGSKKSKDATSKM